MCDSGPGWVESAFRTAVSKATLKSIVRWACFQDHARLGRSRPAKPKSSRTSSGLTHKQAVETAARYGFEKVLEVDRLPKVGDGTQVSSINSVPIILGRGQDYDRKLSCPLGSSNEAQ